MVAFGVITYVKPKLWISVYDNFGPILGGLNILALALCLYLLIRAKLKENEDDPYLVQNVKELTQFVTERLIEIHLLTHRNFQFYMNFIEAWNYIQLYSEFKLNN